MEKRRGGRSWLVVVESVASGDTGLLEQVGRVNTPRLQSNRVYPVRVCGVRVCCSRRMKSIQPLAMVVSFLCVFVCVHGSCSSMIV